VAFIANLREFVRKVGERKGNWKPRFGRKVDPKFGRLRKIVQRVGTGAWVTDPGRRARIARGKSGQPGMAGPHEGNYALLV